jgi:Fic family protein
MHTIGVAMKIPKKPPLMAEIQANLAPKDFVRLLSRIEMPTIGEKYLHWDELRFREPPDDLTLHEWWFGLKWSRMAAAVNLPLKDKQGRPFAFTPVDELLRFQHKVDQEAGGTIGCQEPVTNQETKNTYLVRSLIEEAFTSSQIEGAATTRAIAKAMIREGRKPRSTGERMVLNNYRTMERIISLREEPLSRKLVFEIQRMVTDATLQDPTAAGRFRREHEKIVIGDQFDEDAIYHVPPDAGELEGRMEAMCAFANGETPSRFVHPAIRAMTLHFWLAYDHPFVDGNGRTARALFYWSMLRQGYWLVEFISISAIILKAHVKYGTAFLHTETDGNDLTYFLLYHANIVTQAIHELHAYLEQRSRTIRQLTSSLPSVAGLNHRQRELIEHALRHQGAIYTVESHRRSHGVVTQTARTDLQGLVEKGLMRMVKVGRAFHFIPVERLEEKLREKP